MTAGPWEVRSPNGLVRMTVSVDSGTRALSYDVAHGDSVVLAGSQLGIERTDAKFVSDLEVLSVSSEVTLDQSYSMVHGKQLELRNHVSERVLHTRNGTGDRMDIVLRSYDDGVAFRYEFPESSAEVRTVQSEATSFRFAAPGSAWMQPTQDPTIHAPAYENLHSNAIPIGSVAPGPAWNLPALFHSGSHWVMITESNVDGGYCGGHLGAEPQGMEYRVALPQALEGNGVGDVEPAQRLPWSMPWRAIIVAPELGPVVESSLPSHLGRECEVADTEWIRPGRVSWSWWSDVDSPQNLNSLRDYVDFASEMGWEHTLVDANWTMHPEAELRGLIDYAAAKDVGVFLWYNSGGPHNVVAEQPRDLMVDRAVRRAEMRRIAEWGVVGMKVDFFQSDKQVGIQLIEDIITDAADHQLMVNLHGCTVPRGWTRRWPHLMTLEAVPGAEQYIFLPTYPAAAPSNNTVLPFTRNVVGPMDYTPTTFSDQTYPRLTTAAHELALSVVFESGLQHFADSAESYRRQPTEVVDFLRSVPANWEETRFVAGRPGEFVVLARRSGAKWYLAGINGSANARSVGVPIGFFHGSDSVQTFLDGDSRDEFVISSGGDAGSILQVEMAPFGGFVARALSHSHI